jgi:chromosome segregation ATPase
MKSLYIILPILLLSAFGYFYYQDYEVSLNKEKEAAAQKLIADEKERKEKEETERLSREETARKVAEREKEEKQKEAAKIAKWEADNAVIAADTAKHVAKIKAQTAEIDSLKAKLSGLRKDTADLVRGNFELSKSNEEHAVARRNAEFEAQRIIAQIADRAAVSAAVQP